MLVLGGARSGKSAFAEARAVASGRALHYVATGRAWDDEMRQRIVEHKAGRAAHGWTTHEEPIDLDECLLTLDHPGHVVLVDCLTLWVTNLMMEEIDIAARARRLATVLSGLTCSVILVSNEVGLGIVPDNAMARAFRDHAGRLHQTIASVADEVYFVAAGLPLKMKG